jgi:hypothetical protein
MLIGPSLDYVTYDSLVLKTIYSTTPPGQDDPRAKLKRRVPYGRKRVAYLHLVLGLAFLGIYAVYGGRAAYQRVLTPAWYTWGFLSKVGFIQLAGIVARIKYYAVWSLAEVSEMFLNVTDGRGRVFSLELVSTATIPRLAVRCGTDFGTSIYQPSRLQKASRTCLTAGTVERTSGSETVCTSGWSSEAGSRARRRAWPPSSPRQSGYVARDF